jgi:hypothetical protein
VSPRTRSTPRPARALNGGRIAVIVGCLLLAFISLDRFGERLLSGAGEIFGYEDLTFQKVLGWGLRAGAWLLGVPWDEAAEAGKLHRPEDRAQRVRGLRRSSARTSTSCPSRPWSSSPSRLAGSPTSPRSRSRSGRWGLAPERRGDVAALGLRPCWRARWSTSPTRRSPASVVGLAFGGMTTYLLVHGAWHGAWVAGTSWRPKLGQVATVEHPEQGRRAR